MIHDRRAVAEVGGSRLSEVSEENERRRSNGEVDEHQATARIEGDGVLWGHVEPIMSTLTMMETLEEEHRATEPVSVVGPAAVPGMNLAMALAAERNFRAGSEGFTANSGQVKSVMTLIEETDGVDWSNRRRDENRGAGDSDWLCCVCMERSKGSAFIPCGHTFCRVCSREMWLNRGTCPLCSRPILEILDIY